MKITINQGIPHISTADIEGNTISTERLLGKKYALIFLRDIDCIFCNLHIHNLITHFKAINLEGHQIIIILNASVEDIESSFEDQDFPFTLIPDPNLSLYQKLGLEKSLKGKIIALLKFGLILKTMRKGLFSMKSLFRRNTLPADFLVNEKGLVVKLKYGKHFADHLSPKEIGEFVTSD